MIPEVDEALCRLLAPALPEGTSVRLEPPTPTWLTEQSHPSVVDLFLFGLRDDPRGRTAGWTDVRDGQGRVVGRQESARRYELSYLVTARAEDVYREHMLLDRVLRVATDVDAVPPDCLPDELAATGLPVLLRLADLGPSVLWSALGMPARCAFVLDVSAPVLPGVDTEIAAAAEELRVEVARPSAGRPAAPEPRRPGRWVRAQVREES
ncbi:DUF4255 domain-containing protein [Solihabitans fulvus]|uniref:DUF4255 domain-containing protein n=1 Tax=Solihabitans fulvus TaxID=1892852 RepID=A0A5B2X6R6_9PSEU|nr:Pvc16 family protein [Solihabitans fulvus]KAA2258789.1 DUF4255 domain-containing protein [Solihabitans fulvus]